MAFSGLCIFVGKTAGKLQTNHRIISSFNKRTERLEQNRHNHLNQYSVLIFSERNGEIAKNAFNLMIQV